MFLRAHYDKCKKCVGAPRHRKLFSIKLGCKYAFLHSGSSYIKVSGNIRSVIMKIKKNDLFKVQLICAIVFALIDVFQKS